MSEYSNVNHLVVGAGVSGTYHERGAQALGLNVAVFDTSTDKLQQAIGRGTQTVGTLEEGIDWAHQMSVCTPDDRHTEITIQGTEGYLNILCEKPLTAPGVDRCALSDALQIQQAVHKAQAAVPTHFIVGAGYRLTPAFQEVRRMYENGELGNVKAAYATYLHNMDEFYHGDRETPWRLSRQRYEYGGGFHPLDLAYHVFGPVDSVSAQTGDKVFEDFPFPEAYQVTMRHTHGVETQMRFSAHATAGPLDQNIWGGAGLNIADMPHGTDFSVFGDEADAHSHNKLNHVARVRKSDGGVEYVERPGIYTVNAEIQVLSDLTIGKRQDTGNLPDIDEGVRVMCVMRALEVSAQNNGNPVDVQYVQAA